MKMKGELRSLQDSQGIFREIPGLMVAFDVIKFFPLAEKIERSDIGGQEPQGGLPGADQAEIFHLFDGTEPVSRIQHQKPMGYFFGGCLYPLWIQQPVRGGHIQIHHRDVQTLCVQISFQGRQSPVGLGRIGKRGVDQICLHVVKNQILFTNQHLIDQVRQLLQLKWFLNKVFILNCIHAMVFFM